jgi:hypothetical protein
VVAPALWFGAQRQSLDSAPTEAVIENTWSFTQRIDCLALKRLASEPVELSYCGHRYAFDTATARALHDWAAARDSRACVKE